MMGAQKFTADVLIRAGLIDATGLERAFEVQAKQGVTLGRAIASLGLADESAVAAAIAAAVQLEFIDGEPPEISGAVAALLPAAFCRKHGVAPLALDSAVRVAVTDPLDYSVLQDVQFRTGRTAVAVMVTQTWLERLLERLYPEEADSAVFYDMLTDIKPEGEIEPTAAAEYTLIDSASLAKGVKLPPIVKLVNLILTDAAKAGASDVHIEPHESQLHVRQRRDGLLHDVLTIPHHLQDATISRIKIMSGMDIGERRKPQDGRCRLRFEERRIDLRVSTMPTQFGEKVVIRLLTTDKAVWSLDQLDLSPGNLRRIRQFLAKPQGMILVTGPTGSGKTSTLYTAVNAVKSSTNNIITLEDPIEIQIPGVNQMQVNVRAGVTFANGLRSILRQDPNVILVGEIRDEETADIALGAAQTGHLLLSTLHTNDATATITRLYDLGIQPFMVAASLVGIVAQRLVRRVCPSCAASAAPAADTLERIGAARIPEDARWVAGRGCDKCLHSGFKGRIAIHEVLEVTDEVRDLISTRAAEHLIRRAAMRAGMRTLLEDGIDKAASGLTTLDEVLRMVANTDAPPAATVRMPAAPTTAPASQANRPSAGARRGRVLLVEDSAVDATVVKYFLELEGFEVLRAEDGRLGLEMAIRELPDLIVADVLMPGMGGIEMVKALRGDARTSQTRIMMLTAASGVDSETEGLAAGADDYICKPVEPRRLAAHVKALCARARTTAA